MQNLINIAENYGQRYRITYGAAKMKITVVGFDKDMEYYGGTEPRGWVVRLSRL